MPKRSQKDKRTKNLLIDMDNCLVKYDDNFIPYVTEEIVMAAMELDRAKAFKAFGGYKDVIERIAQESFEQYGQSIIGLAKAMRIKSSTLSEAYHERLDPTKYINPDEVQKENLKSFMDWLSFSDIRYVLFTQSSRTNTERVIEYLGLTYIFNKENTVTSTDFKNMFKHTHDRPYLEAFERLGNNADTGNTILIDDSRSVLKKAFDVKANDDATMRMTTCLIDHGNIDPNPAAYITHAVRNIGEVPQLINRLNR